MALSFCTYMISPDLPSHISYPKKPRSASPTKAVSQEESIRFCLPFALPGKLNAAFYLSATDVHTRQKGSMAFQNTGDV